MLSRSREAARVSLFETDDLLVRADEILWTDFTREEIATHGHLLPAASLARAQGSWASAAPPVHAVPASSR
jgi:hypothetical protein